MLGCIADDLMGAVEAGAILRRHGISATIVIGVPDAPPPNTGALIVALDTRSGSARDARTQSLTALEWLRRAGCRQYAFLYAPTFASTDDGNIGPVADALVEACGSGFALACPAAPASGHRVFQGHLFAGAALLHEAGMQRDPVTPMRDSNLVRVLSRQTEGTVGLVPFDTVAQGPAAIRRALLALKEQGRRFAITDALTEADLLAIGAGAAGQTLVTGSPALMAALAANFPADIQAAPQPVSGVAAILSGSCARATLFQIGHARDSLPVFELNPVATPDAAALADMALDWAASQLGARPIAIATSATPDRVAALRTAIGALAADKLIDDTLGMIATGLQTLCVRRLLVAGGHTTEIVVTRLQVRRLDVSAEIEGDVAWHLAHGAASEMMLAMKPGAVGSRWFFTRAFEALDMKMGRP